MDRELYKKPELLAPAGSFDSMRAAINAGADAVYMGGSRFGARAYAENPDESGMLKAIEFCHLRNRKIYLTVNTLLKEQELKVELYNYLKPLYEAGIDAVIVQDLGVMEFIGTNFPGLDIHVSTQASLTMAEGISGITGLLSNPESITRVVPARELSLLELKQIRQNTDLELEVFIHGALCCCYSGQCLMSSLAGGRSGNRGRCAQPCRRLYNTKIDEKEYKGYYLSPKDMCTLDILGDLIDCGIDSFKIEGRMKSQEYAAGVVSVYRDFIDKYIESKGSTIELSKENAADKKVLSEIYNRGGFNEGYLNAHNGQEMMSTFRPGHNGVKAGEVIKTEGRKAFIKTCEELNKGDVLEIRDIAGGKAIYEFTVGEHIDRGDLLSILTMKDRLALKGEEVFRTKNEQLLNGIRSEYIEKDIKVPVNITVSAIKDEPLSIRFETASGKTNAEVKGQAVQQAINSEVSGDYLKEQVSKLGNTDFYAADIKVLADEGIFVSGGEIKKLKRECAEQLRVKILQSKYRKIPCRLIDPDEVSCDKVGNSTNNTVNSNIKMPLESNFSSVQNRDSCYFIASVRTIEQLKSIMDTDKADIVKDIYLDIAQLTDDNLEIPEILKLTEDFGRKLYFKLPRILRYSYFKETKDFCVKYKDRAGFIATNYEAVTLLKDIGADYRTDHNLYCFNNTAKNRFETDYTLPVELNEGELGQVADTKGELIIYGLLPVMVSAQCAYKTVTGKCGPHKDIILCDEKGYFFRAHSECKYCYNLIYNSAVQCLLHRFEAVKKTGAGRFRLDFTFEDAAETSLIIRELIRVTEGHACGLPIELMGLSLTNGHFNRGVE
ncbi:MAG: U32 family peptidase [Lachnospiraceae bacterium]|nr:U32 family peptidase [Lachnospiraceae bacterium]